MTVERSLPVFGADERATLTGFLDFQRATLAVKCEGLSDAQLRHPAVPPSSLSLLGLVRHMAEVEANWFRPLLSGTKMGAIWGPGMDFEAAFREGDAATFADAFVVWQAECEHSRQLTAEAPSLDIAGERGGEQYTLRWVLTHMIEEYARHNGHADLLRERIDGATGQQLWSELDLPPLLPVPARQASKKSAILLKIYAKCPDGQDAIAKRRIEEALSGPGEDGEDDDG